MTFTEQNSVEHYIINQLTKVNLNSPSLHVSKETYGVEWQYKSAKNLNRTSSSEVLMEQDLKTALISLG